MLLWKINLRTIRLSLSLSFSLSFSRYFDVRRVHRLETRTNVTRSQSYNIYTFFWSRLLVTKAYFRLVGMETKK